MGARSHGSEERGPCGKITSLAAVGDTKSVLGRGKRPYFHARFIPPGPPAKALRAVRPLRSGGDVPDHLQGTLGRRPAGSVDLQVIGHAHVDRRRLGGAIPGIRSARERSRLLASRASHRTPTHNTVRPARCSSQRRRPRTPERKTSSAIIRAPCRAMAATPCIHVASSARKAGPGMTAPPSSNRIPSVEVRRVGGRARRKAKVPTWSQGSGRAACRARASDDLPELEPPFRRRTCTAPAASTPADWLRCPGRTGVSGGRPGTWPPAPRPGPGSHPGRAS